MDTVPHHFSPPAYDSGYGYDHSQYSDPNDTGTARGGLLESVTKPIGAITNPIKDALKPITKPINNVLVSIDPTNKNSNLRALFRDVDRLVLTPVAGILESIWLSPYLAAYLQSLELQINDGRAKHLPPWLKHLIYTRYPNVQIDKVRYGENIKMATIQPGTAMTIGYNIYFPGSINLDPAKIITTYAGGWDLARDVHWILHELEHIVQFHQFRHRQVHMGNQIPRICRLTRERESKRGTRCHPFRTTSGRQSRCASQHRPHRLYKTTPNIYPPSVCTRS